MNLNEECLLNYLQNPDELISLTDILLDFNSITLKTTVNLTGYEIMEL